jgi:hypothetical protein
MNTQMKTLMSQRIFNSNTCRILFATCLNALCLAALSTQAATITVINGNDSGPGSLRQALADANDGDTINFDASLNFIGVVSGELVVDKSVTISGPGAANLFLDNYELNRVFHITNAVTVSISGLTIIDGVAADRGGGILNDHSTLTVSNCAIRGNQAVYAGGAIYNDGESGSASLEINNSTVAYNFCGDGGGGIYNNGVSGSATLTVTNCTISGNSAGYYGYGGGGGIHNVGRFSGSATLTVTNTTISGNSSGFYGGGYGGGIFNDAHIGEGATLEIGNTILKTGSSGANIYNPEGTVTSLGYNLSNDDGDGFLTATGDQINTDPLLGPLQDNGGPTFTHALLTGSPAIDAGDPNFTPPPDYDQRGPGYDRVANGRIDIGAFEVQAAPSPYAGEVQQPINADGSSVFSVRRGVVPVKFTLTQGGVATCDLPPATIALTRTAGGTIGAIDESVYTGSADTGSNFRIDSCQYVYNLSATALGVGTYRVDIEINGQVVGSAVFQLK